MERRINRQPSFSDEIWLLPPNGANVQTENHFRFPLSKLRLLILQVFTVYRLGIFLRMNPEAPSRSNAWRWLMMENIKMYQFFFIFAQKSEKLECFPSTLGIYAVSLKTFIAS